MAFVSSDKFHRELWPAMSRESTFVWGPDLKNELQKRVEMRSNMNEEQRHHQAFPAFPPELRASPIHSVWQKYIVLPMGDFQPTRPDRIVNPAAGARTGAEKPTTIDDLEPVVRDRLKNAFRMFDEARQHKTIKDQP